MKKYLFFVFVISTLAIKAQVTHTFPQVFSTDTTNDRINYLHYAGFGKWTNAVISPGTLLKVGSTNNWTLVGNSGTDPSINFIGTTDPNPLMFKVGNKFSGMIGEAIAPGYYQTFLGWLCGNHSANNSNSGFGYEALYSNVNGGGNSAFGMSSQYFQNGSIWNSSLGQGSLYTNIIGGYNTAIGAFALYLNTSSNNTAVGYHNLDNNTTGSDNVGVGYNTGLSNITGSEITLLGDNADVSTDGLTNATALGFGSTATDDNQIVLGNGAVTILQLPQTNGAGTAPMNTVVPVGYYIITITGSVGNFFIPLFQ